MNNFRNSYYIFNTPSDLCKILLMFYNFQKRAKRNFYVTDVVWLKHHSLQHHFLVIKNQGRQNITPCFALQTEKGAHLKTRPANFVLPKQTHIMQRHRFDNAVKLLSLFSSFNKSCLIFAWYIRSKTKVFGGSLFAGQISIIQLYEISLHILRSILFRNGAVILREIWKIEAWSFFFYSFHGFFQPFLL